VATCPWTEAAVIVASKGSSSRYREPEDCDVFIRDHHEGYISWAEYQENRRRMRGNNLKIDPDASVAAVRSGHGLLTRLLRCGRCGRKLHVRYWGRAGTAARYGCIGDYDEGGSYCLVFGGSTVDRRFSEELLQVISPLGMTASLAAVERCSETVSDERRALEPAGILEYDQVVPWAPWEIRRQDLDSEPVLSLLRGVRETGKLGLQGDRSAGQRTLFDPPHRQEQTQVS
jgi:hypothetical protein